VGGVERTSRGTGTEPPWASPEIAQRLSPISAEELATATLPISRRHAAAYDRVSTDMLLGRSLLALRLAEDQLADLHAALAGARAAAAISPPSGPAEDPATGAAIARWLAEITPDRLDLLVSDLAARQLVDAALYVEATRREARDRAFVMVDLLAAAADQLSRLVDDARGSLLGQHRLAEELPAWQGRFQSAVAHGFASLDLPVSTKAAALVACATKELVGR
jgi:hypothetical protein